MFLGAVAVKIVSAATGEDLNNYTATGKYFFQSIPDNVPPNHNSWGLLDVTYAFTNVWQIWRPDNDNTMFIRKRTSESWEGWKEVSFVS